MNLKNLNYWFQAIIYLLKSGIFTTVLILDFTALFVGIVFPRLQLPSEFYIVILFLGIVLAAINTIKDKIVIVPDLSLKILPEEGELNSKTKYYPIKWENLKEGHSLITRYNIFIKNTGSAAEKPFVYIGKTEIKNNHFSIRRVDESLETEGENEIRVTLERKTQLINNESIQIARLYFVLNHQVKASPGNFFEIPITFGASNAKEKVETFNFRYKETGEKSK